MESDDAKRPGTRVFKKSSPNGKLTVYLGKRDFVDHLDHVDPIDGVVLIEKDFIKEHKVYCHVLASFKYGRDDMDVLGLKFQKDLFISSMQVYPPLEENKHPLTRLQQRLIKKLGSDAYPFFFELPPNGPASVTLQPSPGDTAKPCGVDYEFKAYLCSGADTGRSAAEDKSHKRNSVRLAIRKVTYAPSRPWEQPSVEVSKDFMMSPNKLHLEASLDKELYCHGEEIAVNCSIANNSNRSVKKIKVSVRQWADICLFSTAQYKATVAELESEDGCPVGPGFTLSKVYYLKPLLANNKDKRGLALDGCLKDEDTNLASSTWVTDATEKESMGIIVKYKVKVKLCLGPLGGDLVAELPFLLMHPKPAEDPPPLPIPNVISPESTENPEDAGINTDLIRLDTDGGLDDEDDLIFEDFARLRLKGGKTADK